MMSAVDRILAAMIIGSQYTPLRGRGSYSGLELSRQASAQPIDKARAEAADHERFFGFFPNLDVKGALQGKRVLDFGSGYGGRTVAYARYCGMELICGTEPIPSQIEAGRALAREWNTPNATFDLCTQSVIPYPDRSFDAVTTFDVLEHVADPRVSLAEIRRVLRPGGRLFAVFPLYRGMFSHHLDYITLLPALHLVFAPERIVRVVNGLLTGRMARLGMKAQPAPGLCYKGRVPVLPSLNGMGMDDFLDAAAGFEIVSLRRRSVVEAATGRSFGLTGRIPEVLTFNVACVLVAR